jgi:hypothetical protein
MAKKVKRGPKKPAVRVAKKVAAGRRPKAKKAGKPAKLRSSWFDPKSHKPLIGEYSQRLQPFMQAVADGEVDAEELEAQEGRLIRAMKAVESKLDPQLHAQVTELLCELAAYDVMQMLHSLEQLRPKTKFMG